MKWGLLIMLQRLSSTRNRLPNPRHLSEGGLSNDWLQLRDEAEEAGLDYNRIDLEECLTFANSVGAEYILDNR